MIPVWFNARKDGDTVNHDPVGADVKFVAESVAHLSECEMWHR